MKEKEKKIKRKFSFPWWFKIIAYILSYMCIILSIFWIYIKGIVLGDDTVKKWLTSLVFAFFSSVLLTQPIQVSILILTIFDLRNINF